MSVFADKRSMGNGTKESASEYMKKVFKITSYALSVNKVFIILMLVVSLLTVIISYSDWRFSNTGGNGAGFILISAGMGFFMPVIMFQHMFKRGEYDFYAAMPIKRNRYFWGFTFAGIIAFLFIYTFIFVISAVTGGVDRGLLYFFAGLALFFTVFASSLLAIMLSKSLFVFFLIFVILNGLVAETLSVLWRIVDVNEQIYYFASNKILYFFSPVSASQLFFPNDRDSLLGLLPLLMAVIELAAAFFLHRIRNNEGRSPFAFAKTRYPIQYIVMFMAAFLVPLGSSVYINSRRSINNFFYGFIQDSSFIPNTLIVILITFIMTNMIFENTPRGVFRKIYHLITFTAGYGIVFFLIIGGVIYPNIPMNFVPFESNAAVVCAYGFESKTEAEYDAVGDAWRKALDDVESYIANHDGYDYSNDSEYKRLTDISERAYDEYTRWRRLGSTTEYCLRSTDVTLYLVTDKDYLSYLGKRVKENANRLNYVSYEFGYQDIVAKPAIGKENLPGANDRYEDEYYYSNATVMDIMFFDLSQEDLTAMTDNFQEEVFEAIYHNIYYDYGKHKYDFRTFVDKEGDLEEFKTHTVESFSQRRLNNLRYNYNYNSPVY